MLLFLVLVCSLWGCMFGIGFCLLLAYAWGYYASRELIIFTILEGVANESCF